MKHFVGCAVRTMDTTPNLPVRTTWGGPAHPTMHNAAQPLPRVERNPVGAAHGRDPLDDSTPIRGHGPLLQTACSVAAVALYPAPQPAPATLVRTAHPTMYNAAHPLSQAERNPVGAAHGRDSLDDSTPIRGHGPLLQMRRTVAKVALYPTRPHRPMESAL